MVQRHSGRWNLGFPFEPKIELTERHSRSCDYLYLLQSKTHNRTPYPIGLIAASVVSVGMGFAAEYFDTSFRTPDEVQDFLEIPVLGWVPKNAHDAEVFASSRTNGN